MRTKIKAADVERTKNSDGPGKHGKSLVGAERIELSTNGLRVRLPTQRRQAQYSGLPKVTASDSVTKAAARTAVRHLAKKLAASYLSGEITAREARRLIRAAAHE